MGPGNFIWPLQGVSWPQANPTGVATIGKRTGRKPDSKTAPEVEEPRLRAEGWEQGQGAWLKATPCIISWSLGQTRCGLAGWSSSGSVARTQSRCHLGPQSSQGLTEPGFAAKFTQ